jgi:hypothetical protein
MAITSRACVVLSDTRLTALWWNCWFFKAIQARLETSGLAGTAGLHGQPFKSELVL